MGITRYYLEAETVPEMYWDMRISKHENRIDAYSRFGIEYG